MLALPPKVFLFEVAKEQIGRFDDVAFRRVFGHFSVVSLRLAKVVVFAKLPRRLAFEVERAENVDQDVVEDESADLVSVHQIREHSIRRQHGERHRKAERKCSR